MSGGGGQIKRGGRIPVLCRRAGGGFLGDLSTRHVISFHYTLKDPRGQLIDTSQGGTPISFLEGAGQIVGGLEAAVINMRVGQKARVEVEAEQGYGRRDEDQVQKVLRALLPVEGELKAGDQFQVGEDAFSPTVTVVGVDGDSVWLDANHPLAGVDLTFDVEIMARRPATMEEITQAASTLD